MVIVEATAVSTMACNDLVMPLPLRTSLRTSLRTTSSTGSDAALAPADGDLSRLLLRICRSAILLILLFGYAYFAIAGDAYALVSPTLSLSGPFPDLVGR